MKRIICPLLIALSLLNAAQAADPGVKVLNDVSYKSGDGLSDYERERCKLDIYLPPAKDGFATLVWFHGGGLNAGNKNGADTVAVARSLAGTGIAVICPNYRLSPKVKYPVYIEDAAAAVVWARNHIGEHGGNTNLVFISGHSAGGYLTFMLGLDEHYLGKLGMPASAIAGLIPVSGQTMTHYTVREERGIGKFTITADEAAPVYYLRKETPPMLVLYADHDMAARAEENQYLVAMLQGAGNKVTNGLLIHDRTHGSIASKIANNGDPARDAILEFIKTESAKRK